MIVAHQTEGEFVRHRFAQTTSARGQKLFDADGMSNRHRMRIAPVRITARRLAPGNVYNILDSESQPIKRSRASRLECEPVYESPRWFYRDGLRSWLHGLLLVNKLV